MCSTICFHKSGSLKGFCDQVFAFQNLQQHFVSCLLQYFTGMPIHLKSESVLYILLSVEQESMHSEYSKIILKDHLTFCEVREVNC